MPNKTLTMVAGFGLLASAYLLGCSEPEPKEGYRQATRTQVQQIKKVYRGENRQKVVTRSDLVLRSMSVVEQLGLPESEKKGLERAIYNTWQEVFKDDFDEDIKPVLEDIKRTGLERLIIGYVRRTGFLLYGHTADSLETLAFLASYVEKKGENEVSMSLEKNYKQGSKVVDKEYRTVILMYNPKTLKWVVASENSELRSERNRRQREKEAEELREAGKAIKREFDKWANEVENPNN